MDEKIHDVLIIGSGPAGLTAALYAARAELKPLVIAGLQPGGQLTTTSEVENFPGFPDGIQGPDLMENMTKQVKRFGTEIINENVVGVDFSRKRHPSGSSATSHLPLEREGELGVSPPFQGGVPREAGGGGYVPLFVKTDSKEFAAKTVIIATGAEANWLGLPNEQRLRGKGVSACATCDGFFFKGKDIAVIGGGDSAMEEALFLTKFGSSVTIIHRREEFKASKIMLKRAQENPKIKFVTNVTVVDVLGENTVEGIRIRHNDTPSSSVIPAKVIDSEAAETRGAGIHPGLEEVIAVQGYFAAIGHTPSTKVFMGAGLDMNEKGYIEPHEFTQTNIPGVFVAGDVHDHRYRQAITAAGEGCKAALDAEKYLAEHGA